MKRQSVLNLALMICLIAAFSGTVNAATLVIDNDTRHKVEVVAESVGEDAKNTKILGIVNFLSKKEFRIGTGNWKIIITPVLSDTVTGEYKAVSRQIDINTESEISKVGLADRDFIVYAPEEPACDPSMSLKYYNLLKKISVPKDESRFGKCHDYGWWGHTAYAGYENLPKGYWTYKYPEWYVWKNIQGDDQISTGCAAGKYKNKLLTIHMPEDKERYGNCTDYGWWSGTKYKDSKNLPAGFWVYEYPYWYIYKSKTQ